MSKKKPWPGALRATPSRAQQAGQATEPVQTAVAAQAAQMAQAAQASPAGSGGREAAADAWAGDETVVLGGDAASGAQDGAAAKPAADRLAETERLTTVRRDRPPVRGLDPAWGVDLRQPLAPEPVTGVRDLLAPVLDEPLPVVIDQPPLPPVAELVVLHRAEAEAEFAEPPPLRIGDEPAVPGRFAAGMSVLPHIEFPA